MTIPAGSNRIELESQVLCAALRQSWADYDAAGLVLACQALSQLFPDLVPPLKPGEVPTTPHNFYELLEIDYDETVPKITAAHLKAMKQFLRECPQPRKRREEYYLLLNAGFVLRKPRLRLSHDMMVARHRLIAGQFIPPDGKFQLLVEGQTPPAEPAPTEQVPTAQVPAEPVAAVQPAAEAQPAAETFVQPEPETPLLIVLLRLAQLIEPVEEQALKNQSQRFPDIPVADLIMRAGYVPNSDMKVLQIAEYLITSGKLPLEHFPEFFESREEFMRNYSATVSGAG